MSKFFTIFLFFIPILGNCQDTNYKLAVHTFNFKIQSKILNEVREIVVHVPQAYSHFSLSYPVLYVLDGESHFSHIVGAISTLSSNHQTPPMIVVGILNGNRIKDFTPTNSDKNIFDKSIELFSTSGKAQNFLNFFEHELIPKINKEYKTTGQKLLFGHSLGGLFCLNTLNTNPNLFDAFFAIDPSSWWDNRYISQHVDWVNLETKNRRFIYLSLSSDGGNQKESFNLITKKLNKAKNDSLVIKHEYYPNEDHGTVVHPSIISGLKWYYKQVKWSESLRIDISQFQSSRSDLARFEGKFKFSFNPLEIVYFKKDSNDLKFQFWGQDFKLRRYGDNLFYCKINSCYFRFEEDEKGIITGLVARMPNFIYTEESIDFGKRIE